MLLTLIVTLQMAPASHPPSEWHAPVCSVRDRPVITAQKDLPTAIRDAMPFKMADPGETWQSSDLVREIGLPFYRLVCAYTVSGADGAYVIERERGGRGWSVGQTLIGRYRGKYVAGEILAPGTPPPPPPPSAVAKMTPDELVAHRLCPNPELNCPAGAIHFRSEEFWRAEPDPKAMCSLDKNYCIAWPGNARKYVGK